jgi:ABC-2 type transport system ATP-binding protein
VSFQVAEGEVFGLLGPNGAGKTTTVEILEGYRSRDGGDVTVLGHDPGKAPRELRERIGVVLQHSELNPLLTVREAHRMFAGYFTRPRDVDEVVALVGLEEKRDARVKTLSGGQKRRLDLGVALVGDPDLVFLDEPTTGFDPNARRHAWEIVKNLAGLGKTVFLTTHFMDEAQYLADRLAVITNGRIVAEGTPDTLGGRDSARARIRFRVPPGSDTAELPDIGQRVTDDGAWLAMADDPSEPLHRLTGWAIGHGVRFEALDVSRPSLEDIYLDITGGDEEPES